MLDALARIPLLQALPGAERLAAWLEPVRVAAGQPIVREGARDRDLYLVLAGQARILSQGLDVGRLHPGDHLGELALAAGHPRGATVLAEGDVELARLSHEAFERLAVEDPALGLRLLQRLLAGVGTRLHDMTHGLDVLLRERSMPRRAMVNARVRGVPRPVPTGTPFYELLPREIDGEPVVAALVDARPASLAAGVLSDATIEPLHTGTWEGVRVYRHSVALLLLEAARRRRPELVVRIEHSLGFGQHVSVQGPVESLPALAEALTEEMLALVDADLPLLEQWWTVEEARELLAREGWSEAVELLRTWREASCRLVSYGTVHALRLSPLVHRTGLLSGFYVLANAEGPTTPAAKAGLVLVHGEIDIEPASALATTPVAAQASAAPSDRYEASSSTVVAVTRPIAVQTAAAARQATLVMREHERWLQVLGTSSVGLLNRACIEGDVGRLIRVAEGYQEKRISQIADAIAARADRLKVICIAGPSSSGKSTFIRRLEVQLQVVGLRPRGLSLDDWYVDREHLPRDAAGELDLEAFEALRGDLLQSQLVRLLAGEEVRVARFDFQSGRSHPEGGPLVRLRDRDLLMLEGIHGLRPQLLSALPDAQVFRVFVSPLAQLPLDRLSRVHASDLRLLRRIVRDRHGRNTDAAETIVRWPSVRRGERTHIFPFQHHAHEAFDSSLIYELCVLKVFAERYLLEVPADHPAFPTAFRLLDLLDRFVTIYPDHVPPTSILREFIGNSGFEP
jgi:uridine kinase